MENIDHKPELKSILQAENLSKPAKLGAVCLYYASQFILSIDVHKQLTENEKARLLVAAECLDSIGATCFSGGQYHTHSTQEKLDLIFEADSGLLDVAVEHLQGILTDSERDAIKFPDDSVELNQFEMIAFLLPPSEWNESCDFALAAMAAMNMPKNYIQ